MRKNLLKGTYTAFAALIIALLTIPVTTKAQTTYDLQLAGTSVTDENCTDLSKLENISGKASYDPTTKTLTLQDVTISVDSNTNAISSKIDGLTIKVLGTTNLISTHFSTIYTKKPLIISGDGALNLKCKDDCVIFASETNITIENCTVNAECDAYGICGSDGTKEEFTIKNANVSVEGKGNGSIRDFAKLTLIGCKITEPAGAAFDAESHCVALNGQRVKSKVIITKDATAISTPFINNKTTTGIYSLTGIRLSSNLSNLPKGVYIINGKKIVK